MLIENYRVQVHQCFNHTAFLKNQTPPHYPQGSFGVISAPLDIHNELVDVNPTELRNLFEVQYELAMKEAKTLKQYGLLSQGALTDTDKQYTKYYFHKNQDGVLTVYAKTPLLKESSEKLQRDRTIINSDQYIPDIDNNDPDDTPITDEEITELLSEITLDSKESPLNPNEKVIGISIQSIRNITGYSYVVQMPWHPTPTTITWQKRLLESTADFIVVDGSRQMGKSYTVAEILIEQSFVPGADILVGAFLQKTTNAILNHMKRLMKNFSEEDFTIYKKDGYIYNNLTGVSIHFRTLNDGGDNVLGLTTRLVVVDEAQKILPDVFNDALLPTMTTTGYKVILIGTAIEDTSSYMHQIILDGKLGQKYNNPGQFTLDVIPVSADDNPLIEPRILQSIHENKDNPAIQRQYYNFWGKLSDSQFSLKTHPLSALPTLNPNGYIIYAMDPARLKDRSAFTIFYAFDGHIVTLKSGEVPSAQKNSWETQAEFHLRQLETLKMNFKNIVTAIDSTGVGDGVVSAFRQKGLQINYTIRYVSGLTNVEQEPGVFVVGKGYLISTTMDFFEMGTIITPKENNAMLIEEFQYANVEENRFGQLILKSVFFDDTINSFMIGLYVTKKFQFHNRTAETIQETNAFGKEMDKYLNIQPPAYKPPTRIF